MHKRILAIALPAIAANITTPLLGLVDTAIVGHMGSPVYIGAIAVGGIMYNVLYWLFAFLRGGTSGLTAQAYGADDAHAYSLTLWRSLSVAGAISLLLVMLQRPLGEVLCLFFDADAETSALAMEYFYILIYGAPAVMGLYALSGWFLGMQNSRMLMWTSLVINVVNIATSLVLVYGLDMGIAGVALGTLVSQWVGFGTGWLFMRRYRLVSIHLREILRHGLGRFFSVNFHLMLRTACMIAVTVWFTRVGASQGAVVLAVNSLLIQLFLLFSYMMDGFAYAGQALAGRYVGARDAVSLRRCVRGVFVWGGAMACLFTALYTLGGQAFLGMLSSDGEVVEASREYFFWALTIPMAGFPAFVWDGIYIGVTLTRELFFSVAVASGAFFVVYFSLYPLWGNHALWLAFIVYLVLRGLLQTILYRSFTFGKES